MHAKTQRLAKVFAQLTCDSYTTEQARYEVTGSHLKRDNIPLPSVGVHVRRKATSTEAVPYQAQVGYCVSASS